LDAAEGGRFMLTIQSLKKRALVNIALGLGNNRVAFTLAQRHLRQLDPNNRHPIVNNAGTITSLRGDAIESAPILTSRPT
jgi:hypothetical protein